MRIDLNLIFIIFNFYWPLLELNTYFYYIGYPLSDSFIYLATNSKKIKIYISLKNLSPFRKSLYLCLRFFSQDYGLGKIIYITGKIYDFWVKSFKKSEKNLSHTPKSSK